MPSNKNNEDLTKRQADSAKQLAEMIAELDNKAKLNAEEARKNEADRLKNAEERARIEGANQLLEMRSSTLTSDETQLAEKHKLLKAQAEQLSARELQVASEKAEIDAEKAGLLPQMRAVIEAGELALARESKSLDVMDLWAKSQDRIASDLSSIAIAGADTKKLLAEVTTSISAGFEAVGFVKDQVTTMFKYQHEANEFLKDGQATIINGMRDGFDHIDGRVARVLQVSQRTIKFVKDLRSKAYESQEKMASLEVSVSDINKQTLKIVKAHHEVVMGSLDSLSALPGKIGIEIKNLNAVVTKMAGTANGVITRFRAFNEETAEHAQEFHNQVIAMSALRARHEKRLDNELESQVARYQEVLNDGARDVIKSFDKIVKESDSYEFISKVHLYKEQLDHVLGAASQLLREIQSEELEFSSEIKKTGTAVKENLNMAKDGIGGAINEIDGSISDVKNQVATATAELSDLCRQIIDLKAHLVRVASEAQNLTAMASQQSLLVSERYSEQFGDMFTKGMDAFADKVADRIAERSFERDLKDLGGDVPE
jgi:archaellum component FlaC